MASGFSRTFSSTWRPALAGPSILASISNPSSVLCRRSVVAGAIPEVERLLLGARRHTTRSAPFWFLRVQLEIEVEQLLEKIPGDAGAIVERDRFLSNHQRGIDEARVGGSRGVLKIGMQGVC